MERRVRLLYTDTDSLILQLFTADLYADMNDTIDLYDTSNYQPDHPLYSACQQKGDRQVEG